jgi:hypothetical protein
MTKDLLIHLFLAALLLAIACTHSAQTKDPSAPYAKAFAAILQSGVPIVDGGTIRFEVRGEQDGEPLHGARVFVGEQEIRGEHGRFDIPYSRALIAQNPTVRVLRPPGYAGPLVFNSSLAFTFSASSEQNRTGSRELLDLTGWATLDVGPDRIYLDPPHTASDAPHLERLLAEGRVLLESLTGVSPPPLAIALARDDTPERFTTPDRDHRIVWLVRASQSREESLIGFIAHEWTHGLLDQIEFPDDAQLRYVEDGLAELVGLMTERRLLRRALTPVLQSRRAELARMTDTDPVDLYALAAEYHASSEGKSLEGFLASIARPGVTQGYALGLAYWVHRTGAHAEAVRAQFDAWRRAMPSDAAAMDAALRATGTSARAFTVAQARAWLSAH